MAKNPSVYALKYSLSYDFIILSCLQGGKKKIASPKSDCKNDWSFFTKSNCHAQYVEQKSNEHKKT